MKREWLIAFRKAKGLSQNDVSNAVNVSQTTYAAWELGLRRPRVDKAKKLAKIFGFDWAKFYE
ncbi:MAG TPA: helix-turn-helix transcriptional regulator [Candidatus Aphodocola excrementigallinarum]|uniref:Helix-turn-helix transcriptional regulator n=1 Tax=Candidatus Aphodocola excrementigallinarum TaxID=2840670 RepID=A0A9D1IM00_9FIRM|nr:helix-turn-helix transcriptional regulator [Candidatus Aphodocola excrementigallinarum]